MKEVTTDTFTEIVEQSTKPVLIDFWAPWCAPCKVLAVQLGKIVDDRFDIVKIDCDANPVLAERFDIRSIPTLILFKDGQPLGETIGLKSGNQINEFVNQHL